MLGLALLSAGCSGSPVAGGTTSTSEQATSPAATRSAEEAVHKVEQALAGFVGVDPADIKVSGTATSSPSADTVVEWTGGKAELDSRTAIVYAVTTGQPAAGGGQPLSEDRLRYEAVTVAAALGWSEGALQSLGFKEQPGTLAGSGVYTMTWKQYDAKGAQLDGSVVLSLDDSTAALVNFSAWPGSVSSDIAGAIPEAQAMQIAETQIYLRTDQPKLSLDGNGSVILLNRKVTEELKIVSDKTVVKNDPRLCWVITVLGTVGTQTVGGTTYLDAASGAVLKYEAYKSAAPVTTTTTEAVQPR
jgi:hypothetical protein